MHEFVSLPAGLKDERWQNSFHNFLFKCNRFLHFLRQQEPMTQRDSFQLIFERYLEKEEQIFQTPNVNLNMNKPIREGNSQKLLESNERLTSSSLSTNQLINSHTTNEIYNLIKISSTALLESVGNTSLIEFYDPEQQKSPLIPQTNERTVQNYRRALGFYPRKQQTKVKSTQTQVERRHLFAVEHQNSDIKKWIFIDETQIQLRNTGKIVWVKRGELTPTHEISSLRAHVNLWGAVWWNGKTFARHDDYINQTLYQHLLASHLGPHVHKCRRYAVAQDKLRSHWAKLVRQWFNDHGLKLLDWPPHSPEFNAIENVWHSLKETVKTAQLKTQAELEVAVDQACHLISQKVIQGCISHVSTLIKEEASN
ncbi:unnamed protein product [Rotaria sp. Silwood1]|nr:unnamed protein product [Rotaria sp. Silwood1]CAF1418531.1 unnamed protein product [Rotaria sp. Silwood1]CAF3546033.1 unnamed protein product [Rotaria sp. Silwood1]CAF3654486.1 unnamed protein product [Rotaria sp. Silwood1]CAF4652315.1 unnamed protein product [Rotaria sp. Silwood1]